MHHHTTAMQELQLLAGAIHDGPRALNLHGGCKIMPDILLDSHRPKWHTQRCRHEVLTVNI